MLEAVYKVVEAELFPNWPDSVVYAVGMTRPKFFSFGGFRIELGDWRPGFLNAGAPLVFVATFKLLDMFVEWVLEANAVKTSSKFQGFKDKLKDLDRSPVFPVLVESQSWLKERLVGLYRTLEPLRGTIVHGKHFDVSNGGICVASSRGGSVGPQFDIDGSQLRKLAITVLSIIRYVDGTWSFSPFREKLMRCDLDSLANLHGFPSLGQKTPLYPTIRVHTRDSNPLSVDIGVVVSDLEKQFPNNDRLFDLRVLTVANDVVSEAFLFPWSLFADGGANWAEGVNPNAFIVPVPEDVKLEDCLDKP